MSTLSVDELSKLDIIEKDIIVRRNETQSVYKVEKRHNAGMAGVVWKVRNDVGIQYALKTMPKNEYENRSLADEVFNAAKLDQRYFPTIHTFGDFCPNVSKPTEVVGYAIISEWVDGIAWDDFCDKNELTVSDFLTLCEQLCRARAQLCRYNLCHDDLHPGNVLIAEINDPFQNENILRIKVVDTGTIKPLDKRQNLLGKLRDQIAALTDANAEPAKIEELKKRLEWFTPDDHLRSVECMLRSANSLCRSYHKLDLWERRFVDTLHMVFNPMVDSDEQRRLDEPSEILKQFQVITSNAKRSEFSSDGKLRTPFDYISAEMIRNDQQFANLFSKECPWLNDCKALEPLYIYGPRGCGKSSVLRWLSFKVQSIDATSEEFASMHEIGVYLSCSVELRSRFWLFSEKTIDQLEHEIVLYFNLLLLEELFETLECMYELQEKSTFDFGLSQVAVAQFANIAVERISAQKTIKLAGQKHFEYLRNFIRKLRWQVWARIRTNEITSANPDPALISDICSLLAYNFDYFKDRHITFLIDDYSNQRIPIPLQIKLNNSITFAKQGSPIFKVSSEYNGVDLEGITEGREVVEINIGEQYTSVNERPDFLKDIMNIRLQMAGYTAKVEDILGFCLYDNLAVEIAKCAKSQEKFYYHGLDCIHWICSGDVALAIDLIRRIYERNKVDSKTDHLIPKNKQHAVIHQFSHNEIKRIKYIVPFGEQMHDIILHLGAIARTFVREKVTKRIDRAGQPVCKTHIDIRVPVLDELARQHSELFQIYRMLTSRALLFSIATSRSRIESSTERIQLRKILLPAFTAPLKRDVPIKIDTVDDLVSLLSSPKTFAQRELKKASIDGEQLSLSLQEFQTLHKETD